jgi:hypothetical protein
MKTYYIQGKRWIASCKAFETLSLTNDGKFSISTHNVRTFETERAAYEKIADIFNKFNGLVLSVEEINERLLSREDIIHGNAIKECFGEYVQG